MKFNKELALKTQVNMPVFLLLKKQNSAETPQDFTGPYWTYLVSISANALATPEPQSPPWT